MSEPANQPQAPPPSYESVILNPVPPYPPGGETKDNNSYPGYPAQHPPYPTGDPQQTYPTQPPGAGPYPSQQPGAGPYPSQQPGAGPYPSQQPGAGPYTSQQPGAGPYPGPYPQAGYSYPPAPYPQGAYPQGQQQPYNTYGQPGYHVAPTVVATANTTTMNTVGTTPYRNCKRQIVMFLVVGGIIIVTFFVFMQLLF